MVGGQPDPFEFVGPLLGGLQQLEHDPAQLGRRLRSVARRERQEAHRTGQLIETDSQLGSHRQQLPHDPGHFRGLGLTSSDRRYQLVGGVRRGQPGTRIGGHNRGQQIRERPGFTEADRGALRGKLEHVHRRGTGEATGTNIVEAGSELLRRPGGLTGQAEYLRLEPGDLTGTDTGQRLHLTE